MQIPFFLFSRRKLPEKTKNKVGFSDFTFYIIDMRLLLKEKHV